jgi:hypothetical protein
MDEQNFGHGLAAGVHRQLIRKPKRMRVYRRGRHAHGRYNLFILAPLQPISQRLLLSIPCSGR